MPNNSDLFDPKALAVDPKLPALAAAQTKPQRLRQRARSTVLFARIPYETGMRLAGQTRNAMLAVLLELDHLVFVRRGRNPVELTNTMMRAIGVSHQAKIRALRKLEAAGMVTIIWRGRRSPLVTVLWHPAS
jgi:DNA-binding transcriptional ArsR family regulator